MRWHVDQCGPWPSALALAAPSAMAPPEVRLAARSIARSRGRRRQGARTAAVFASRSTMRATTSRPAAARPRRRSRAESRLHQMDGADGRGDDHACDPVAPKSFPGGRLRLAPGGYQSHADRPRAQPLETGADRFPLTLDLRAVPARRHAVRFMSRTWARCPPRHSAGPSSAATAQARRRPGYPACPRTWRAWVTSYALAAIAWPSTTGPLPWLALDWHDAEAILAAAGAASGGVRASMRIAMTTTPASPWQPHAHPGRSRLRPMCGGKMEASVLSRCVLFLILASRSSRRSPAAPEQVRARRFSRST